MTVHSVDLKFVGATREVRLDYVEFALTGKTQARFQNRRVLVPDIDIAAYECRAVIDWIDLGVRTNRPTQWKWIQHQLEKAMGERFYVTDRPDIDTRERSVFHIRIQEPTPTMILAAEEIIDKQWGLQKKPEIVNMEISIDFRPKRASDDALRRMFSVLTHTHLPGRDVFSKPKDRPRFAWGEGTENSAHVLPYDSKQPDRSDRLLKSIGNDSPVLVDSTYYVGQNGSNAQWRIMVKTKDRQNKASGTWLELPEKQQRVRIEVTLDRNELREIGVNTFADLQAYRFQTFQGRYFEFRLPTFKDFTDEPGDSRRAVGEVTEQERRQKFFDAGVIGLKAMDEAATRMRKPKRKEIRKVLDCPLPPIERVGAGKSSSLVGYEKLSKRVYAALRHLGERVSKVPM